MTSSKQKQQHTLCSRFSCPGIVCISGILLVALFLMDSMLELAIVGGAIVYLLCLFLGSKECLSKLFGAISLAVFYMGISLLVVIMVGDLNHQQYAGERLALVRIGENALRLVLLFACFLLITNACHQKEILRWLSTFAPTFSMATQLCMLFFPRAKNRLQETIVALKLRCSWSEESQARISKLWMLGRVLENLCESILCDALAVLMQLKSRGYDARNPTRYLPFIWEKNDGGETRMRLSEMYISLSMVLLLLLHKTQLPIVSSSLLFGLGFFLVFLSDHLFSGYKEVGS